MWDVRQRGNCGITRGAGRVGSKEQFVVKALRAQTDRAVTYWLPQGKLGFVWIMWVLVFCGVFLCFFFFTLRKRAPLIFLPLKSQLLLVTPGPN